MYNVMFDENKLSDLHMFMYNNVFRDSEKNILKNTNFLIYLNNKPVVANINCRNNIHITMLPEGNTMLLKEIKIAENQYRYELKNVDNGFIDCKRLMESCYNFKDAMNSNEKINTIEL